jgi:hypothetical protein
MSNPPRFSPVEALSVRSLGALPLSLHMGGAPVDHKIAILRLLTGTLNIKCNYQDILIEQRVNYSQVPFTRNARISSNTIRNAILPFQLTNLDKYARKSRTNNVKFYRELFIEFSNYFLRLSQDNQIGAFLHLYRILESIAYCFPLIWASRAKDYEHTFVQLRDYFNGAKTGELGVFKKFLDEIIDPQIQSAQIQFVIASIHPDWQKNYYNSLFTNILDADVVSYNEYTDITVKCHCLTELMINIRNHYFHFLTGQANNFSSDDIAEANEFFKIVNEIMANWLSIIFFEVLDYEMSV